MDSSKKFYLLAEIAGWDCHKYIEDYGNKLKKSEAYRVLTYNIPDVKNFYTKKAKEIVEDYNNLSFEPKTIKDCFILEEKINYLALYSHPEYYINPLAIAPTYIGEINSIGDLKTTFKGKELTINEIIMEDETPIEEKKRELEEVVDDYLYEVQEIVSESIVGAKSQTNAIKKDHSMWLKRYISAFVFDVILFFFLFFFYIYPNELFFNSIYKNDLSEPLTYIHYLYPSATIIKTFLDVLFYSFHSKIYEPINYARRFLYKNSDQVFRDVHKQRDKLVDYINGAISSRIKLINDITSFSILSLSYVDLEKIVNVQQEIQKTRYKKLYAFSTSFTFITLGIFIFSIIVYFISTAFNLAV